VSENRALNLSSTTGQCAGQFGETVSIPLTLDSTDDVQGIVAVAEWDAAVLSEGNVTTFPIDEAELNPMTGLHRSLPDATVPNKVLAGAYGIQIQKNGDGDGDGPAGVGGAPLYTPAPAGAGANQNGSQATYFFMYEESRSAAALTRDQDRGRYERGELAGLAKHEYGAALLSGEIVPPPAKQQNLGLSTIDERLLTEEKKRASRPDSSRQDGRTGEPADSGLEPLAKGESELSEEKKPATEPIPAATTSEGASATPAAPSISDRVNAYLSRLDRRPGETPHMMFFRYWGDNSFVESKNDAQSTFGVDVDTASYTLTRNYLYKNGNLPPAEALRTEEFVNYFDANYAPPAKGQGAFKVHCEIAPSPYAHDPSYKLLKIGLKAREVPRSERKSCSLVFVVDTSGSMRQGERLETVKKALRLLVGELDEGDTIGIVAFDSTARVILEPSSASERDSILSSIDSLHPNQSTNVDAGLQLGYEMASKEFRQTASNRVILLSDGVANTGVTDQAGILANVRTEREKGIYLTTIGVGMGNHNDALLEQLADKGNGQCVYVDRLEEARKVFVENLSGTLETVAKDVKIQVEFDKGLVSRYRQLGYENRAIADKDFRNNKVDAGEIGAGHEVTAIYEIKLTKTALSLEASSLGIGKLNMEKPSVDEVIKAGTDSGIEPEDAGSGAEPTFATVRVRYLTVDHGEAVELERHVETKDVRGTFAEASGHFQLCAHVAEFAEILRDSYWARGSRLAEVAKATEALLDAKKFEVDDDHTELVALMKRGDALVEERRAATSEVAMVIDALKENRYLRAQIETARQAQRNETRRYLEDLRRQNDDLRRRLEKLLVP